MMLGARMVIETDVTMIEDILGELVRKEKVDC